MSEAVKAKKGGNLIKIIIVVLLVLILVGGAAFAGYFIASTNNKSTTTEATAAAATKVKEAFFLAVEAKLVNLADTDSKRYAKMTITIGYDSKNKKIAAEFEEKKTVIVDAINSTIRNKKAAEFDGKGAEDIKKELLTRINSLLETGRATNIYYDEILIQ